MASTKTKARGTAYSPELIKNNIAKIIGNANPTREEIISASPVPVAPEPWMQGDQFIDHLFEESDYCWIVAARKEYDGKCRPTGELCIHTKDYLRRLNYNDKLPRNFNLFGGYIGVNGLLSKEGSGKRGRPTDCDVRRHEYLLLEHDDLPTDKQLAVLVNIPLPIVSLVDSGGKSIHAIVRVGARSADEYSKVARELYRYFAALGMDCSNVNPSRLTRFPGTSRYHPNAPFGHQRLLYLNPDANHQPIITHIKAKKAAA